MASTGGAMAAWTVGGGLLIGKPGDVGVETTANRTNEAMAAVKRSD